MNTSQPHGPDLLRLPLVGRLARWRWGRVALQVPLVIFAALMLIDGFYGSRFASGASASRNLATVAAWVHYRGIVVLVLLLVGNLFCMACPFTLPRTLAKRLSIGGRRFPRFLRNKWVAIAGLFLIFFLYEWLDLWASPALTAWVIVAYFLASFLLEAVFKESAFCKYVCPLGTFNFVYATASPARIGVHDGEVCRTCVGKECINGSYSPQPVILVDQIGVNGAPEKTHDHNPRGTLGCGTELFAPQITSNMDCVFCMDCVRACPHDNVGLFARSPLAELSAPDGWRKSWDMSLLVIVLAFMGVTNAFGMVPPVYALIDTLGARLAFLADLGWSSKAVEGLILLIIQVPANILLPIALTVGLSYLTRALVATSDTPREVAGTFAPAFVPIGFGVWLSHYLFHFLIGIWSIVPVIQSFFGFRPNFAWVGIAPGSPLLSLVEIGFLLLGFGLALLVAGRRARARYGRHAMPALMPWAFTMLVLMLVALAIMNQPMEMRGVELFGM